MGGWEIFPMLTWDDFEWITCWDKVAWSGRTANIMHLRKGFKHQTTPISVLVTFYIQYVTNVIWSICISYTYMCMYNINIYIYIFIHHWFSWPGVPPNDPFGNVWLSNQSPASCDHQKRHDFRSCCDDCLKNYICVSVKFLYMKMSQTIWDAFIHAIANYFWKHSWPVGSIKRITCLSPSKGSKHQSILLLWSQLAKMCFLKTLVPPYISGVPSYLPEEPP